MADNRQKWQDATREILRALDLAAEYRLLGVDVCGSKPSAKGWIECRAFGMEDKTPSAGINVHDGPFHGRYKNFRGDGKTFSLFDFAATVAGKFGGDWKEARNYYARQANIKLPDGDEELVADRFEFFDLTAGVVLTYARGKEGVSVAGIQEVGSRGARWPKGLSAEKTNHLIATPMYGSALLDLEPIGWHCVASNPERKIRKYQGKGHEEALLKTMTCGEYGLMGVDGLNRLAGAKIVNIVEGISDLYAAQSAISAWRKLPATGDVGGQHVVLSAGGCSYHPKPEWLHHFAGKEIRIWFDVGDAKNEGQVGAAVWVAAMLPVASSVRNVQLPLGKDGGKNDLRAWLVSGNSYAEMDAYAQTFDPIKPTDEGAQLSVHQAILKNLGLVVIGEHEGTQKIEIFSEQTKKPGTIPDIDKLSIAKLIQFLGPEVVDEYVHDGKEPQPGKVQMREVKNAIAAAASDRLFHGEEKFGAGVWDIEGHTLVVKDRECTILSKDGRQAERCGVPFFCGRILDMTRLSGDWFDHGQLVRYLEAARKPEFGWKAFEELEALLQKWYWRHKPAPRVAASLVACTWVQTTWSWRPQVALTGSSDTGKSVLLGDVLHRGIFGKLALYAQKPTEAAIRQHMKHHARALILDEFEHDQHRPKVLELLRTSSQGGETIRGTADQRGTRYRLQHISWVGSIELGLRSQADRNRFIILDMESIPAERRGKVDLPTETQLHDLGMRLLAVAIHYRKAAAALADKLKGLQFDQVPGRIVESFSAPMAMEAAIFGHGLEPAAAMMQRVLQAWDFSGQSARDEVSVLQAILLAQIPFEGGMLTVSQLLSGTQTPDVVKALNRSGLAKVVKRNGAKVLFICAEKVQADLLRVGSTYHGQTIEQYLMRLKGAKKAKQRLGGEHTFYGVEVPDETINNDFKGEHDGETDKGDTASETGF